MVDHTTVMNEELSAMLLRRGGVRVYTFVTETSIEEQVTRRDEHVDVTTGWRTGLRRV
jgi:hypothetical protein